MRKHGRDLERAHHAHARNLRRARTGDVAPAIENPAARRLQEMGEQIEYGRLARAVRSDERVDRSTANLEIHVAHRNEPLELLGERLGFQDHVRRWDRAQSALACSLNRYFWIFPVAVLGSEPNTTCLG